MSFVDGWFYGPLAPDQTFSGESIAYVYSDLTTALVGRFRNEVMEAAREAKVTACRCSVTYV